ncbi:hypothetical protein Y032_0008g277 [Ancylostoma ceylanicum]|uniref:Uncharacterized protein n=1 Tax=Ancylostoma ceylanicum TaxID=53326 RepID=A0A016VK57_9BILA|nr:hypothetical protein Y032_0008g277 [Ancylostoma ceylanicum]
MRRDFELKFDNREYHGYVLILDACIWFWVGLKDVTSLGLALFPMSSMLIDTPNTQNVCVKAISMRIAKIFQGRQVRMFVRFSVDLVTDLKSFTSAYS